MTKTYTSCIPFHSVSCKMQIIHKLQFNEMKEKCNCILCIHIIMKESKCLLPQSNSYMQLYFFLSLAPSFLHTYYKQFFLWLFMWHFNVHLYLFNFNYLLLLFSSAISYISKKWWRSKYINCNIEVPSE